MVPSSVARVSLSQDEETATMFEEAALLDLRSEQPWHKSETSQGPRIMVCVTSFVKKGTVRSLGNMIHVISFVI